MGLSVASAQFLCLSTFSLGVPVLLPFFSAAAGVVFPVIPDFTDDEVAALADLLRPIEVTTVSAPPSGGGCGFGAGVAGAASSFPAGVLDLALALAVALALFIAGTVATGIGFLLPWMFQRHGLDPALAAGPLATVLQDVLSLAVYLAMVTVLLT